MNDKELSKSYKSHNKPQSSHCLVVHEDAHLSYTRYKIEKLCFKGHPRYTSTNIHIHTLFLYFLYFSFFFIKSNKQNTQTDILKKQ